MRRTVGRRRWLVIGGVVIVAAAIFGFELLRGSTVTRQDMLDHLDFPAVYQGRDEAFADEGFTLRVDGTVTLQNVVLGTGERRADDGRPCVSGDMTTVTGEGRWWADDSGWVIIESAGYRSRFHQDDPLLMAEGWGKIFLLTPCEQQYSAIMVTPDARYSE